MTYRKCERCHKLLPHNSAALSLLNHLFWFDGLRHLVYTTCLALNSRQTKLRNTLL